MINDKSSKRRARMYTRRDYRNSRVPVDRSELQRHKTRPSGSDKTANDNGEDELIEVWESLRKNQVKYDQHFLRSDEAGEVIDGIGSALGMVKGRFVASFKTAAKHAQQHYEPITSTSSSKQLIGQKTGWGKVYARFRKLSPNRKRIAMGIITLIAISGFGMFLHSNNDSVSAPEAVQGITESRGISEATDGTPVTETEFELLYPAAFDRDNAEILRMTSDNSDAVYVITDTFHNTRLTISQQILPTSFASDKKAKLKEFVGSLGSADPIDLGTIPAYKAETNKSGGAQLAVFVQNGLLIFVTAERVMNDYAWVKYLSEFE